MTIALQSSVIYGPVGSRRFGTSLGINLLPAEFKLCNFNCGYCQYGFTHPDREAHFPSIAEIRSEAGHFFAKIRSCHPEIRWIMIAGNGEPTLHPEFDEAVRVLTQLRDEHCFGVPIGILSNSSTCHRSGIRSALLKLDGRFMKWDAGCIGNFRRINQPDPGVDWRTTFEALACLPKIVLQSMFVTGAENNSDERSVEEWIENIALIRPEAVQIYTIDRPPAEDGLRPVPLGVLYHISTRLTSKTGIPSFVYE